MPYKSNNTNQDSKSQKGQPTDRGNTKAGAKTTGGPEDIQRAEDLVAKHLDDQESPVPEATTHPNRNTNKPNIDKPGYGGS